MVISSSKKTTSACQIYMDTFVRSFIELEKLSSSLAVVMTSQEVHFTEGTFQGLEDIFQQSDQEEEVHDLIEEEGSPRRGGRLERRERRERRLDRRERRLDQKRRLDRRAGRRNPNRNINRNPTETQIETLIETQTETPHPGSRRSGSRRDRPRR